jgi:carbamoyl-phosphate synthase small subunit
MKAVLVLEDGKFFVGRSFGKQGETISEVVFHTGMTGYQEICTDPSYAGQMVAMTYPLIGNYGMNEDDAESQRPHTEGFIVKELCEHPSHWRCTTHAQDYFRKHDMVGIEGIDTRALTAHLRNFGSMWGMISTKTGNIRELVEKIKQKKTQKRNLVMEVTTKVPRVISGSGKKVVLLDFGAKENIIRSLQKRNCNIHILPAFSAINEVMDIEPSGILLSNGPGDPASYPSVIALVKELIGKKPILGICLGHQLLGLALGGKTYKLKFGHHGGNHPVMEQNTKKCIMTSQNHNYALAHDFSKDVSITHVHLNDQTVEGFTHKNHPIMAVQFHPEGSPGPYDSQGLFDAFLEKL